MYNCDEETESVWGRGIDRDGKREGCICVNVYDERERQSGEEK